jgi:hypothetical protein
MSKTLDTQHSCSSQGERGSWVDIIQSLFGAECTEITEKI